MPSERSVYLMPLFTRVFHFLWAVQGYTGRGYFWVKKNTYKDLFWGGQSYTTFKLKNAHRRNCLIMSLLL